MFLVGKAIPDYIKALPQTVLNTPFGQMLRPYLDRSMRAITQAPVANSAGPRTEMNSQQRKGEAIIKRKTGLVNSVVSLNDLNHLLSDASNACAIIFFTSSTCAPCALLYPAYNELAATFPDATFIKCDLNYATEIGSRYHIRATPTIQTYLKNDKFDEWSGANERKLRSNVELLVQAAFPRHPHCSLHLPEVLSKSSTMIKFPTIPPFEKVLPKLHPFVENENSITSMRAYLENLSASSLSQEHPLPDLSSFCAFLKMSISNVASENLFAAYDILRPALVDKRVNAYFVSGQGLECLLDMLEHVTSIDDCPFNLKLVTLQLSCNLFSNDQFDHHIVQSAKLSSLLLQLVQSSTADDTLKDVAKSVGASLAFNTANAYYKLRTNGNDSDIREEAQVELGATILDAISRYQHFDSLQVLITALGLLVYQAPVDGELLDLCRAMEAAKTVNDKESIMGKRNVILKEVGKTLLVEGLRLP